MMRHTYKKLYKLVITILSLCIILLMAGCSKKCTNENANAGTRAMAQENPPNGYEGEWYRTEVPLYEWARITIGNWKEEESFDVILDATCGYHAGTVQGTAEFISEDTAVLYDEEAEDFLKNREGNHGVYFKILSDSIIVTHDFDVDMVFGGGGIGNARGAYARNPKYTSIKCEDVSELFTNKEIDKIKELMGDRYELVLLKVIESGDGEVETYEIDQGRMWKMYDTPPYDTTWCDIVMYDDGRIYIQANSFYYLDGVEFYTNTDDTEMPDEIQKDFSNDDSEALSDEDLSWYMDYWAKELEPIVSAEELQELNEIDWPDEIQPYIEYDWLSDEGIDRLAMSDNLWNMQLADINLDGQPEMLVCQSFNSLDDLIHVFSIQDGTVVYCGKITGGTACRENEMFMKESNYLPAQYIDVYQNDSGELRYLSGEDVLYQPHGYYQIYESTFDGTGISCKPVYAIGFSDNMQGNTNYEYTEGDWLKQENIMEDDGNYTAFREKMEAYMKGYEKKEISFLTSAYRVPGFAGELPQEQQENVRNNIIAGIAETMGYIQ